KLEIAADRGATRVLGPAVGGFHDPGATAGHDCEPGPCEQRPHLAGLGVTGVILGKAGRTEDGNAGAEEVEPANAREQLRPGLDRAPKLKSPGLRPFKEAAVLRRDLAGVLAPVGAGLAVELSLHPSSPRGQPVHFRRSFSISRAALRPAAAMTP